MADADIYLVPTNNVIQWGRRVYYYNCHKEGGDYKWHSDNFPSDIDPKNISLKWIYDGRWAPYQEEETKENVSAVAATAAIAVTDMAAADQVKDEVAENMLLYQRKNGGWPKHFQGDKKVDYKKILNDAELKELAAGYEVGKDATIDNEATTKEIKYLVKIYKQTKNEAYLQAANRGVDYLLAAQNANGGWPQYFPDVSSYRSQITYNDNAMVNVLNLLWDVVWSKNDMDAIDRQKVVACENAVQRGVDCILKTQIKQNGKLTAWCAQYNAKTLQPEMARKFELVSLSGSESVGIVRFLMRMEQPSQKIIESIKAAVEWFDKVKIVGYKFEDVPDASMPKGYDRKLLPAANSTIWARFYTIDTNEPFFTGRDSKPKKDVAEIDAERRNGYAWYGNWPEKLLQKEYPAWAAKNKIN